MVANSFFGLNYLRKKKHGFALKRQETNDILQKQTRMLASQAISCFSLIHLRKQINRGVAFTKKKEDFASIWTLIKELMSFKQDIAISKAFENSRHLHIPQ